ncbi:MAG TPA: aldehyde ferredoxin oxidoreductase family protein [Firmicutes bacterium]|nr:aldehyde ferredoxin oxidoreductase family protein [Bacillota bacterium]
MGCGYMDKVLWVDLAKGTLEDQALNDDLKFNFLGGYGIGLRLIYSRQRAQVDPLSGEAIIGLMTGPLTGTGAVIGTRYTVLAKSPLTGTWGDANSGGYFGPALKMAGYDGVFLTGTAQHPVYILIDNGKASIHDARHIWGKTTYETEDILKREHGKDIQVASIGPAGEMLNRFSCVVNDKGRVAARFGLGAVLGSKNVKAVVAKGNLPVEVADPEAVKELRKKYVREIRVEKVGFSSGYLIGTPGYTAAGALNGDSPVKNWKGAGSVDFTQEEAEHLHYTKLFEYRTRKYGCWRCPIVCGGVVSIKEGPFALEEAHQPEYETMAAFGSNCGNSDLESIIAANDVCNRYGIDTISAGAAVAFAIECYENGLITKEDTGGLELAWGNGEAIVELTKQIALGKGLGAILSKGLDKAAMEIGNGAEDLAIHVMGEGIAMHDPRFEPAMAVIYKMFPGKHIQASQFCKPAGFGPDIADFGTRREEQAGRGRGLRVLECLCNVVNCAGACLFGYLSTNYQSIPEFLTAVTGLEWTLDRAIEVGERISNLRQAFNIREKANPVTARFPARALGIPPLEAGPTAGFTVDLDLILGEYLDAMGWSRDEGKPSRAKLQSLGLEDVAHDLYGG